MNMPSWARRAGHAVREKVQRAAAGVLVDEDAKRRTWWGRTCRYWLSPTLYWLDCLDEKRRPSHSKILATIAFLYGLHWTGRTLTTVIVVWLEQGKAPPAWLFAFVLAFSSLVFALPYGLNGLKAWLVTRGGGTVQAFERAAEADSPAAAAPGKGFLEEPLGA